MAEFLSRETGAILMESLVGKKAVMAVDPPKKKLYMKDRVEILGWWKLPLKAEDRLGKGTQLRIRSLERPSIEEDVDFGDIVIPE